MPSKDSQFANLILDRVKNAYDMSSDAELADFLGVAPSTVSSWRRRETVDFQLIFAKCGDIRADYIIHGDMPIFRNEKTAEYPPNKSDTVKEKSKDYANNRTIAKYEQRIDELAEKIEHGPFSQSLKVRLIEMIISIIGEEINDLQKGFDSNPEKR